MEAIKTQAVVGVSTAQSEIGRVAVMIQGSFTAW